MKKTKLTLDEHREIGKRLNQIYQELQSLGCLIPNTYGKTSRAGRLAGKAGDAVSNLRCELDDQFYRDFPQKADLTRAYYCSAEKDLPLETIK
jgi:hypothetical protein